MHGTRIQPNTRIRALWVLLLVCALIFIARLYWLQVVRGQYYAQEASHQYFVPRSQLFDRGNIYMTDREGNEISIATTRSGFTLAIDPTLVEDADELFRALSAIVDVPEDDFFNKVYKQGDTYEEIVKRLGEKEAEAIRALSIPGIILVRDKWRYYPAGNLGAHMVGFVGYQGDELSGRYGLERYYNDVLDQTEDGSNMYSNFFARLFSDVEKRVTAGTFQGDVVTTIEPNVQMSLQRTLSNIMDSYSSESSGGIILNPNTGEVYALAASPSFDPNLYSKESDARVFGNPLIESVFEMGSIIKPLTMAAGLDAGVVAADTVYDDKGYLVLNTARISNFDGKGRGRVDMQQVLNQSLNTGAAFVVSKLGNKRFAEYFMRYELGEETGVDLPGETHGLIDNLKSPRDIEYATASYGQGIAMTPIETARALASLSNGGYLVTPYVAKQIRYTSGLSRKIAPDEDSRTRILQPETSEEITRMLVKVFDEALLDGTVKMERYSIAAKTGTAQIPAPGGGYYEDRYLHSFFGYFPAYEPKFLVFLYTIHPKGVQYASQTLARPFVELAKSLISYYNVPPDR